MLKNINLGNFQSLNNNTQTVQNNLIIFSSIVYASLSCCDFINVGFTRLLEIRIRNWSAIL